jgi:hypothetical protein
VGDVDIWLMKGESVAVPYLPIPEIGLYFLESMEDQIVAFKR